MTAAIYGKGKHLGVQERGQAWSMDWKGGTVIFKNEEKIIPEKPDLNKSKLSEAFYANESPLFRFNLFQIACPVLKGPYRVVEFFFLR